MSEHETAEQPGRRDFLMMATGAAGAVGTVGLIWPFISSMAPNAAVRAAGAPVEINVSAVEPGQAITVKWRDAPYFVRRLTEDEVSEVQKLGESDMKQFETADARLGGPEDGAKEWTVVSASCTHLGCIPAQIENGVEGWNCPCHGSVFDMAGRILRGPAATNLPLPPYVFATAETLVIGREEA